MAKNFYEITMEHSNGVTTKTYLVKAKNSLSAVKKAEKQAFIDCFYPVGTVLIIKKVTVPNM